MTVAVSSPSEVIMNYLYLVHEHERVQFKKLKICELWKTVHEMCMKIKWHISYL